MNNLNQIIYAICMTAIIFFIGFAVIQFINDNKIDATFWLLCATVIGMNYNNVIKK